VIISDFTIKSIDYTSFEYILFKSNNSKLLNCNILCVFVCVSFPSTHIEIINNNIQSGVGLVSVNNIKIMENTILTLTLSVSSYNEIKNNKIYSGGIGLFLECYNNEIFNNEIKSCEIGLMSMSNNNRIFYNDFISNDINAFIYYAGSSQWRHNFWGKTRINPFDWKIPLPKPILGYVSYSGFRVRIDFDWHPALKPNCDFVDDI
jgi:hypothetical protein